MTNRFRLQYTKTNDNGDTDLDVDITFENADYNKVRENLNTWLSAIGMQLHVEHRYTKIEAAPQNNPGLVKGLVERKGQ
jgi:hypothetical protein